MHSTNHKISEKKSDGCNHQEHKKWSRRSFLQTLGIASGGSVALAHSAIAASSPTALTVAMDQVESDRVLVIVRLKGGNDGLNTIIPINQYDTYANARPGIKIPENQIFNLNDSYGMPTYANKFEKMWGDGQMKVIHGVGYNNTNLSHFASSDIWATADTKPNRRGWLGRYFEDLYPDYLLNPPTKPAAVQIGSMGNRIFTGDDTHFGFSVADPKRLFTIAQTGSQYGLQGLPDSKYGEQLKFLRATANATVEYAGVIHKAYEASSDYGEYPMNNKLSDQLSIVSRLIKGNLGTKVYMVTLSGYDTHSKQLLKHEGLTTALSDAIAFFFEDLKNAGWDDKVMAMTISEFGRRVNENGSKGTDHGTAAPVMLFGKALNGNGFIGEHPSLNDLDSSGNVLINTDFRQVYASIMKDWIGVDEDLVNQVLLGEEYNSLDLGFDTNTNVAAKTRRAIEVGFEHTIVYTENQPHIHITTPQSAHMDISLYDMSGRKVTTLKNEFLLEGKHIINIKKASNYTLSEGFYAYQIKTNSKNYSKSVMIY